MTKRAILILLAAVFVFGSVTLASALGDGNHRKGKYLFRKSCRSCHIDGGSAKVLEPATYTMAEWTQAFDAEKAATYPCADNWKEVGAEGINDIYTYLHKFAADSPTPAKCK